MNDPRLPKFEAGQRIEDQFSVTKMNALVDYVRSISPISGKRIRCDRTESGTTISFREGDNPFGGYENPYQLGETNYGSSTSGPGGATGSGLNWNTTATGTPWGGSSDTPSATMTDPRTDEWCRLRPPLKYADDSFTTGVKITVFTRTIITAIDANNFTKLQFARVLTFDSRGYLYNVSAETIVESDTISGSGSAGGGL